MTKKNSIIFTGYVPVVAYTTLPITMESLKTTNYSGINSYPMADLQFSRKTKNLVIFLICLACIFLFLYTANSKITDHPRFLNGLVNVEAISRFAVYISWLVPVAEILVSVLLIIPQTSKWGLYGFIGLMVLFTGYITSMVLWAKKLPCHCGGAIEKLSWTQHIWFNLAFIALAVFALWLSKTNNYNKS